MNAFVVSFIDPALHNFERFISCVSTLKEASESMLSFVCSCPGLDFSVGFFVRCFVDGVFDRTIYYSYDPSEYAVSEVLR